MKTLAIEIIKMEGVEKSWNTKFYQPGEQVVIYINNEKIDITEKVNHLRDKRGIFQASPVIDEYMRLRSEINRAGLDAYISGKDKKEAMQNYINNL
jgi:rRNA-processing protein FCF1